MQVFLKKGANGPPSCANQGPPLGRSQVREALEFALGNPNMTSKLATDPRIDPRIKAVFGDMPPLGGADVPDRETLLERERIRKTRRP